MNTENNSVEILLNRIKIEIEELEKTTDATLLMHDGKIAETLVYIKENLSNAIKSLLDDMKYSKELDEIITASLINEYREILDGLYPAGNVKRYGAIGDGKTDDTQAFRQAIEDAKENGTPLVAPYGKYLISQDLSARYIKLIDIKGELIGDVVFEVGGSSADGSGYNISISKLKRVKVVGLKNSIINVDNCDLLSIYADGDDSTMSSTAYCQFYGAYAKEISLDSTGDNIGWINENIFRIKRVDLVTMKGNYEHNNNRFEHINFEKGVLKLGSSRNNYFSARGEGGIQVSASDDANSNFLEKEYYYRHYFGEDTGEAEGTYTYYHINKLQDERMLLVLDANSTTWPISAMQYTQTGKFTGNAYNEIFHSNLIKIDKTFSLKAKSDVANLRVQLKFYDENKNLIKRQVTNYADGKITYLGEGTEWNYTINANVSDDAVTFFPGDASYVEYRVLFGGNELTEMTYVSVKLVKMINTDIHISNSVPMGIYTAVPTKGYYKEGTRLYGKNPRANTSIGIVCVESGVPGVWKNFGSIAS